jgi:hypothetical protein
MQLTHVISDMVLAVAGLYVFFKYLSQLTLTNTVLWESFVLSVAAAALFGAIRFAGFHKAAMPSAFFQNLAAVNGGVGLVVGALALVTQTNLSKLLCYIVLVFGFLLFVLAEAFNIVAVGQWVPVIAMVLLVLIGIFGFTVGAKKSGTWLIVAVAFFALGNFRNIIFGSGDITIDIFHYLTAAGLLALGMAVAQHDKKKLDF